MLSQHPVNTIAIVPTAQSISDALAVSPYMDHVVDNWLGAYIEHKAADAVSAHINAGKDIFQQTDTPELLAAYDALVAAHREMLTRWSEYKATA